jgi:hypothetical protein
MNWLSTDYTGVLPPAPGAADRAPLVADTRYSRQRKYLKPAFVNARNPWIPGHAMQSMPSAISNLQSPISNLQSRSASCSPFVACPFCQNPQIPNKNALLSELFCFVARCVPYTYKMRNEAPARDFTPPDSRASTTCWPSSIFHLRLNPRRYHFLRFNALTLQRFNEWRSDSASQKPLSRADLF